MISLVNLVNLMVYLSAVSSLAAWVGISCIASS